MRNQSSPTRNLADGIHVKRAGLRRRRRARAKESAAFADCLAHDLRTPLTVIQEYAALMREGLLGALNDEQQRGLDVIADRACDLNRAVENAVDAGKLAGKTDRVWGRRCSLHDVLARIGPRLVRKAQVLSVDLQVEAMRELPDIHCDEEFVGRALVNIVAAVLNLSRGGQRISMTADLDRVRNEAGICVRVDGAGHSAVVAQLRALGEVKPANHASRLSDVSIATAIIDRNLGTLDMTADDGSAATLWIGFPVAEPMEVLQRHLHRVTRRHPLGQRVALFRAESHQSMDRDSSREVGSLLNSLIGRDELAVELDRTHWLLALAHKQRRAETLRRRIGHTREVVNRRRLGQPLPHLTLQSIGSWQLPSDFAHILAIARRQIPQSVLAGPAPNDRVSAARPTCQKRIPPV
jgi:hypothetical protein